MRMRRKLFVLLAAALLVCAVGMSAVAQDVPDLSRRGSIRVAMRYGGKAVPGGDLILYRVGAVREDDGNFSFELTGAFAGCGVDLEDIQSASLAKQLADYAGEQGISGDRQTLSSEGTLRFEDLEPGLYLLIQKKAADGYSPVEPFLVSVPMVEDGGYLYDVDASPKVELTPEPAEPTPTPTAPSDEPKLPQTGQLNWPVPVLAALGLGLCGAGWALRSGKKKDKYEK